MPQSHFQHLLSRKNKNNCRIFRNFNEYCTIPNGKLFFTIYNLDFKLILSI
jgi:hypothetical protein